MPEPIASRPHMPGYGVVGAEEGSGLLPWSWARSRLEHSRNYWVATTWPDGRPHVMPVWGVWQDGLGSPAVGDRAKFATFSSAHDASSRHRIQRSQWLWKA